MEYEVGRVAVKGRASRNEGGAVKNQITRLGELPLDDTSSKQRISTGTSHFPPTGYSPDDGGWIKSGRCISDWRAL
jgi:hypothetical protein